MMKIRIALLFALLYSPAMAQEPSDPRILQHAIASLETQRNQALAAQTIAEAKLAVANEKITQLEEKLKAIESRIEKLKEKPDAPAVRSDPEFNKKAKPE